MPPVLFRSATAVAVALVLAGCTSEIAGTGTAVPSTSTQTSTSALPSTSTTTTRTTAKPPTSPSTTTATSAIPPAQSLPLSYGTSNATQVITVTATSTGSTTATVQAWQKTGGAWQRHGGPVFAHIGSAGMTAHPSESMDAAPIGSYTITQAFGALTNPGTSLPYRKTDSADWWISQYPSSLYNTLQHCATSCPFTTGEPNEHLHAITPQYNYAVVIDYNTRNSSTGVRQGAGSAFFLHVTDGTATAGCVAIPQSNLAALMRWLTPSAHPRILIGVS